jgi:hypothetical protein
MTIVWMQEGSFYFKVPKLDEERTSSALNLFLFSKKSYEGENEGFHAILL